MILATRTINPLHFEDLEPKRFEDLVRNIIYDFKNWRQLEPCGRSGNDGGFDIRGWEITGSQEDIVEEDEDLKDSFFNDNIWLIQCKREKQITPKKLVGYVEEILKKNKNAIFGIIFVAACNFSEAARKKFLAICREHQVQGFHLLGKAELEDLLFQPKNDRLLFAYFGISLIIRRRTLKTKINAKLAIKKKAKNFLIENNEVLLRDPNASDYPYSNNDLSYERKWKIYQYRGHHDSGGLIFLIGEYFAYFNKETKEWDYLEGYKDRKVSYCDPWDKVYGQEHAQKREPYVELWLQQEESTKAYLEILGFIPYENIIAIDEIGDDSARMPHIYVEFKKENKPFKYCFGRLNTLNSQFHCPKEDKRVNFFKPL